MNLVAWVPWVRAWDHAEAASHQDRALNTIALVIFTSLPVLCIYAGLFGATWLAACSLTALFFITLADLNPHLVATYIFDVPPWLCSQGFRRSIVTKDNGSCFFDSVRLALGKTEKEVRAAIAKWIDDHKDDEAIQVTYHDQSKGDATYTQRLRDGDLTLWGDALEARALSEVYQRRVAIYSQGAKPTVFEGSEPSIDLYFTASSVNGKANHYRLLRRSFFDDWVRF